jgi:hypothetical protein
MDLAAPDPSLGLLIAWRPCASAPENHGIGDLVALIPGLDEVKVSPLITLGGDVDVDPTRLGRDLAIGSLDDFGELAVDVDLALGIGIGGQAMRALGGKMGNAGIGGAGDQCGSEGKKSLFMGGVSAS